MSDTLLELDGVTSGYENTVVLEDVSLGVESGEVVAIIGRNGAGKTTTLRTVMGHIQIHGGTVRFDGHDITGESPEHIYRRGIGLVPEHREIFPGLTVEENLRMGGVVAEEGWLDLDGAYDYFPRLEERKDNLGRQLSGGEKQMLSIARALMGDTELLMLDEPTEGLAPQIVADIIDIIETLSDEGLTVLIVEQNLKAVQGLADRNYVISQGTIVFEGTPEALAETTDVQERYLGVSVE